MSRQTTIKLPPALDLSSLSAPVASPLRSRGRSASIVKVEEVGDRSLEEILDRSAYVNINANWVNAKGILSHSGASVCFGLCLFSVKVPGSSMSFSLSWGKS